MRKIAAEAGLSPGNAYYYFPSKQHLVQHFYAEIQTEHRHRAAPPLAGTGDLATRLAGALHAGIDAMTPYHAFAASFIKGRDRAVDRQLAGALPELLWLAYLGLTLFAAGAPADRARSGGTAAERPAVIVLLNLVMA